jgi:hypothetical protein
MTEPTPFLHLTILADGQVVYREELDVRGLAGAQAVERLVNGHHEVARRYAAAGHRVQVRLVDPDGLAGTAVIDIYVGGVMARIEDVDPGVDAAWHAWRRSGRSGAPPARSVQPPRPPGAAGPGIPPDPGASDLGEK